MKYRVVARANAFASSLILLAVLLIAVTAGLLLGSVLFGERSGKRPPEQVVVMMMPMLAGLWLAYWLRRRVLRRVLDIELDAHGLSVATRNGLGVVRTTFAAPWDQMLSYRVDEEFLGDAPALLEVTTTSARMRIRHLADRRAADDFPALVRDLVTEVDRRNAAQATSLVAIARKPKLVESMRGRILALALALFVCAAVAQLMTSGLPQGKDGATDWRRVVKLVLFGGTAVAFVAVVIAGAVKRASTATPER